MNWPTESLGSLCDVMSGGTPKRTVDEYWNGEISWVKISDMLQGEIKHTDESITDKGLRESPARLLEPGTLLLSIFATVGRTAVLAIPAATNQAIVGLRIKAENLDQRYLRHYLDSQAEALKSKSRGVAQDNINTSILKNLRITLPPLEEQRRIAAILDRCHESELLATKATSLYSCLFKASFHSFLRQVEDRESVPQVPLSSVCTRITKGTTPSSLGLPDADGDIPFVRVQDIDKNILIAESVALQIPTETHRALSRSMLQSGDILVSIAGTIGRVCEVRSLPPHGANCTQAVAIARPIPDVVRPLLLKCLLSDWPAQKQMRGAGVTGTITNLSLGQLGEIKIPVPSIEAQDKICDQLERLAKIGERFQNSFVTAKLLTDSLTSRLMSGT